MAIWNYYNETLKPLADAGYIEQPYIPDYAQHNAHMYYIKVKDLNVRTDLIRYMKEKGVLCVFHYIPLHLSEAGKRFGRFSGEDVYTTRESERLMRLPMFYNLDEKDMEYTAECLLNYPGFH